MECLSLLSTLWTSPINFVVIALVIAYALITLKDILCSDEYDLRSELGVVCGSERTCAKLAAAIHPAERFELYRNAEQVLEQAMRRKMIIVFIIKDKLSGIAERVFTHLQHAFKATQKSDFENLRYAVFGVGDTRCKSFNALAMELDIRLRKIGATSVTPMYLFDVCSSTLGIEQEFTDFVKRFAPQNIEQLIATAECSGGEEESDASDYDNEQEEAVSATEVSHEHREQTPQTNSENSEIEELIPEPQVLLAPSKSLQEKCDNGDVADNTILEVVDDLPAVPAPAPTAPTRAAPALIPAAPTATPPTAALVASASALAAAPAAATAAAAAADEDDDDWEVMEANFDDSS